MSELAAIQADFRARLLGDDPHPGFAVYRATYRNQLHACLTETFATTRDWLGQGHFDALADRFAAAHPPHGWSLDHFPAPFPGWLAADAGEPVAADLARIEWALATCFAASDAPVLTTTALAAVDWDTAELAPAASTRVLTLASNAAAIHAALQAAEPPPLPAPNPATVLVWRRHGDCHVRVADPVEADLLMRCPARFASLCDYLAATLGADEAVPHAAGFLARAAAEEWLVCVPG